MRMGLIFDVMATALIAAIATTPALAIEPAPAPVVGVGLGAVALMGIGYRALKRRIER